jgi:MoaE-MoaD fusion protein
MSSEQILVRLKLFATARELVGERELDLNLPTGSTIRELKDLLASRYSIPQNKINSLIFSKNHEFVPIDSILENKDEIGVFPPVSGGAEDKPTITSITSTDISLDDLSRQIVASPTGAAVVFTGFVRGETPGNVHARTDQLEYDAYEPMAVKKMQEICLDIRDKWPKVYGIFMVQRIGNLKPLDIAVAIGVSCGHRDDGAFEAARFGIDRLKEIVPVWKKEIGPDGEVWVEGSFHPEGKV